MIKFAILLLVGIIARQTYADKPEAIIGGNNAELGQFKHQVSLQGPYGHKCGGSLISEYHVVTAAHCIPTNKNEWKHLKVITGTIWSTKNNGESHDVKCISVHPNYTDDLDDGLKHDIAVITLKTPAKENEVQAPIGLATRDYATGKYRGIISGWGMTSMQSGASSRLKWVDVNVLSLSDCLDAHYPITTARQICTLERVGKGACQGDSGGPLIVNNQLCGIVSWAVPCAVGEPDVFTNLYYYWDFILEAIDKCMH